MRSLGERILIGALYLLTSMAVFLVGYTIFGVDTVAGIVLVSIPVCLIVWYIGVIIYIELDERRFKLTNKKKKNWSELTK